MTLTGMSSTFLRLLVPPGVPGAPALLGENSKDFCGTAGDAPPPSQERKRGGGCQRTPLSPNTHPPPGPPHPVNPPCPNYICASPLLSRSKEARVGPAFPGPGASPPSPSILPPAATHGGETRRI